MRYRFGDWIIDSALTLPELPPATEALQAADFKLTVERDSRTPPMRPRRWLHHWRDINGRRMLSMARTADGGFLLRFPGTLEARLDACASKMVVRPLEHADPATVRHQLIDQLLPRALAYRGGLLLHAGAVVIEGHTVLVIGESGWGKSTLVAAFHTQGHSLLTDDCVLVRAAGEHVHARGTYPSLRLLPDTLVHVMDESTIAQCRTAPMDEGQNKRRVPVLEALIVGPDFPVAALYLLKAPNPEVSLSTALLTPGQACIEIMKNSFQLDVSDRAQHARQLSDAGSVATRVPAFELTHPRNFERLPDVVAYLKDHVRAVYAARLHGQLIDRKDAASFPMNIPQGQA